MTVLLPSASRRSRFLFDWDARHCIAAADQSLNARSGQAATFSRASTKTVIDAGGGVASAPHSLPGFQWSTDPVTGLKVPEILMEDARTNLLLRSQEFDNAAWFKGNVTITANAAIAPDGSLTADKATATSTAGTLLTQPAVVPSTAATYSIFAKQGSAATEANSFLLYNSTTATSLLAFTLNYGTGVITYTAGSSGVTVVVLANGWWHITMTATSGITSGDTLVVYAAFSSGVFTGGTYAYLWGAQLEVGKTASSYIPTVSAVATRAVDSLNFVFNGLPSAMTVYVNGVDRGNAKGAASNPYYALVGLYPNYLVIFANTGASGGTTIAVAGGSASTLNTGASPSSGDTVEVCGSMTAAGVVQVDQSLNGGAITGSTPSGTPALASTFSAAQLNLASADSGAAMFGYRQVRIAAGVQSIAYMRAG